MESSAFIIGQLRDWDVAEVLVHDRKRRRRTDRLAASAKLSSIVLRLVHTDQNSGAIAYRPGGGWPLLARAAGARFPPPAWPLAERPRGCSRGEANPNVKGRATAEAGSDVGRLVVVRPSSPRFLRWSEISYMV